MIEAKQLIDPQTIKNIKRLALMAKKAAKAMDDLQEAIKVVKEMDELLSVNYLMQVHPNLSEEGANSLLEFAKSHTIRYKECYGDGSIIFPMWNKEQQQ